MTQTTQLPPLVTTWHLDYQGPELTLPAWPAGVYLYEAEVPSPELSQFLFVAVGAPWRWYGRLGWTYQQWAEHLSSGQVRTFVLYQRGTPAGFFELCRHPEDNNSVELKYFGLLPAFVGQGLGGPLVQAAIALAQQWSQGRVWLHTCSDDHPAALATYQKQGFVLVQTETEVSAVPPDYTTAILDAAFAHSRLARFKQN